MTFGNHFFGATFSITFSNHLHQQLFESLYCITSGNYFFVGCFSVLFLRFFFFLCFFVWTLLLVSVGRVFWFGACLFFFECSCFFVFVFFSLSFYGCAFCVFFSNVTQKSDFKVRVSEKEGGVQR